MFKIPKCSGLRRVFTIWFGLVLCEFPCYFAAQGRIHNNGNWFQSGRTGWSSWSSRQMDSTTEGWIQMMQSARHNLSSWTDPSMNLFCLSNIFSNNWNEFNADLDFLQKMDCFILLRTLVGIFNKIILFSFYRLFFV
jgi:hypothetical protein